MSITNIRSNPIVKSGTIVLKETITPTPIADYGQHYFKSDNKAYYQDGAGVEHELAAGGGATTINWIIIATGTTAVAGNGYFCDTSTGFILTMPASPLLGDTVWINDLLGVFADSGKNLTINFNGENHMGVSGNYVASSSADESMTWVYSNSTYGWKRVAR